MKKKTSKETKTKKLQLKSRTSLLIVLIAVGLLLIVVAVKKIQQYDYATSVTPLRELVLRSSANSKRDALVDPKTGDVYFPEAKLFVPYSTNLGRLTYSYDPNMQNTAKLTVSNQDVFARASIPLYNAKNSDELFKAVPKLQACQRGVKLTYEKIDPALKEGELKRTVQLSNNKALYMYVEPSCPDLAEVLDVLQTIKPY